MYRGDVGIENLKKIKRRSHTHIVISISLLVDRRLMMVIFFNITLLL